MKHKRYVDADQVCSADKWNISKNEGKHTMNNIEKI